MSKFWEDYKQVEAMLKQAFIQIPGGQPQSKEAQDPAMAGMPQMDPAMAGGVPPEAAGGMPPMDPAMAGGVPPEMAGGMPLMDPAMAGMVPPPDMLGAAPGAGAPGELPSAAPGSPMITITLDQLFEIIQKVLGLAKKVGPNGQSVQAPVEAAPAGITQDQLKASIYEALGNMVG